MQIFSNSILYIDFSSRGWHLNSDGGASLALHGVRMMDLPSHLCQSNMKAALFGRMLCVLHAHSLLLLLVVLMATTNSLGALSPPTVLEIK